MAIGLAIRSDVHELRLVAIVRECANQAVGEVLATDEQSLESDGAGDWARHKRRG